MTKTAFYWPLQTKLLSSFSCSENCLKNHAIVEPHENANRRVDETVSADDGFESRLTNQAVIQRNTYDDIKGESQP